MSEWWSYRLSSFLLFSPRTYFRLHELYNLDVWPAQLAGFGLGVVLLAVLVRRTPHASRVAALALAVCWAFVAWAWHLAHYATINWAATYFGAAFAIQAALLLWFAFAGAASPLDRALPLTRTVGTGLLVWGLVGVPIATRLLGRTLAQADYFGTGPDPTVIATLGVFLLAPGLRRWPLWLVPVTWCAVAGAFASMMRLPDALLAPLAALIAIVTAVGNGRMRRRVAP